MNLTFKQMFPTWQDFYKFLSDYSIYNVDERLTHEKALVYHSMLFRQYANSHAAYDRDVFFDQLSLLVTEHFNEFFKIKELLELMLDTDVKRLVVGVETITNVGENANMNIGKDEILPYIGTQSRQRSQANIVEVVTSIIPKIRVKEITSEVRHYEDLFIQIIPHVRYFYGDEIPDDEDYSYAGEDYEIV